MVSPAQKLPSAGLASFIKSKWRAGKDSKSFRPNTKDDVERDRTQHDALKLAFGGNFKAPLQRLLKAGGSEVLDIGCGAGIWTMDMATSYPISYFRGIDIDKNILPSENIPKNALFQCVDVTDLPLPYEDNTFDYIFVRSMMDSLPDDTWDVILQELVRVMKKGAFLECIEAYPSLFEAGPAMTTLAEFTTVLSTSTQNPWPNRLAAINQLMAMQIEHLNTPVGVHGSVVGKLLIEYWEHTVQASRNDWVQSKRISEKKLDKLMATLPAELDEYHTHMSWYSVVAQKKGYVGPIIQFDDCEDLPIP